MILPSDNEPWPLISDVIAVTSSGSDVPRATTVSAITESGTPTFLAMIVPLSTKRVAPNAMIAAPSTSRMIATNTGISFSSFSSAGVSSGLPLLLRAVRTVITI